MQKARHHPINEALTACKFMVSGSLSLPSRGSFHLSLTVLFTIGGHFVFSLATWSSQIQTGFHVPRSTQELYRQVNKISHTGLSPSLVGLSRTSPLSC